MKIRVKWESTPALYSAYDEDTYDGASDSSGKAKCIGYAKTQLGAIIDLFDQYETIEGVMSDTPETDAKVAWCDSESERGYLWPREEFIVFARKLERQRSALLVALEMLMDCQNGCPLPKYEKGWNRAMELSRKAIEKCE